MSERIGIPTGGGDFSGISFVTLEEAGAWPEGRVRRRWIMTKLE